MSIEHLDEVYEDLFKYGLINPKTIEKRVSALRPYLRDRASTRTLVSYEGAREHIGTSSEYLGRVLGAINECEYRAGNPLLTALVVKDPTSESKCFPSAGFFGWPCIPDEYERHPNDSTSLTEEEIEFWEDEVQRVFSAWAER